MDRKLFMGIFVTIMLAVLGTVAAQVGNLEFENGKASWYSPSLTGVKTASGEPYTPTKLTAAHRTLPFGTYVRVTNLHNDNSVVVRINDRGPFIRGRVIDLSQSAANQIGMIRQGVASVKVDLVTNTHQDDSLNQHNSLNQDTYSKEVQPQPFPSDPTILSRLVTELNTQFYYFSW